MLKTLVRRISSEARAQRAAVFREKMAPRADHLILDLGGGNGSHFNSVLPDHQNVVVADHWEPDLAQASDMFGYETVRLDGSDDRLPFKDGEVDIVFCSSVIEHVTGPKDEMVAMNDAKAFADRAWKHQTKFAQEIRRISKGYFVQTPHRRFPIEHHTYLPQPIIYFPRPFQRRLLKTIAPVWPADVQPDWRLLDETEMIELFPDSELVLEKSGGFRKVGHSGSPTQIVTIAHRIAGL